jgi:transposase InsO family protein
MEGKEVAQVARDFGVSRRTVHKWLSRYRQGGEAALENRTSRPHRSPCRVRADKLHEIERLRGERKSSLQIASYLSMPVSTVTLSLRRLGLNRLSRLQPKPQVQRYEHSRPGEMIHLDIKKLGRIDGIGHRITGDRSKRKRGAGWEYLHVCVDDHSRLAYTELLPDEKATTSTCFLIRAAAWLQGHGVTINRVMTDNGSGYRSHLFLTACQTLGARPIKTRPYTPRTNGKAERFIQTSLKEWAYAKAYETSAKRETMLQPWLDYYNTQRPHTALNHKPPISRIARCEQRPC